MIHMDAVNTVDLRISLLSDVVRTTVAKYRIRKRTGRDCYVRYDGTSPGLMAI